MAPNDKSAEEKEKLVKEWERRFAALSPEDRAHIDGMTEEERSFVDPEPELRRATK